MCVRKSAVKANVVNSIVISYHDYTYVRTATAVAAAVCRCGFAYGAHCTYHMFGERTVPNAVEHDSSGIFRWLSANKLSERSVSYRCICSLFTQFHPTCGMYAIECKIQRQFTTTICAQSVDAFCRLIVFYHSLQRAFAKCMRDVYVLLDTLFISIKSKHALHNFIFCLRFLIATFMRHLFYLLARALLFLTRQCRTHCVYVTMSKREGELIDAHFLCWTAQASAHLRVPTKTFSQQILTIIYKQKRLMEYGGNSVIWMSSIVFVCVILTFAILWKWRPIRVHTHTHTYMPNHHLTTYSQSVCVSFALTQAR